MKISNIFKGIAIFGTAAFIGVAATAQINNPGVNLIGAFTANDCVKIVSRTQIQSLGSACNAVVSVFGRTGAVIAAIGDYSFSQISGSLATTQLPAFSGGDVTSPAGSAVSTLATVNSNVGSFGGVNSIPSFTVDGKGRITAAAANVPAIPFAQITSKPSTLAGYGITSPLGYAEGGCNATTQSGCTNNIFPTVTRAGDIAYWNGTTWVTLPGNNSGTRILQMTAAGVPSWAAGSSTQPTVQSFTTGTAATYATPVGAVWLEIIAWGPGGSAGSCGATSASQIVASGGGGGGGYVYAVIPTPAATYTYTVGQGGAAAAAGANNGNSGTAATTVNVKSISAGAGTGGVAGTPVAGSNVALGGTGGIATGGDTQRNGPYGSNSVNQGQSLNYGGQGGNGPNNNVNSAATNAPAGSHGGGSGCSSDVSTAARVGGTGDAGSLTFIEHYN